MFKKFMAKMGIGSAKVDLVLDKRDYDLGELVQGQFRIEGGSVEQKINKLDVDLVLRMYVKGKEYSHLVSSIPVTSGFIIQAGERKELPFTYELPYTLPLSRGGVTYSFQTRLDIAAGVDNLDQDVIQVHAPKKFNQLIEAFGTLGFREKMDSGKFNGYTQEFELFPTTFFKDQLSEAEFEAAIDAHGIRILLELDLLPSRFGLGEKEIKREVYFSNEQLNDAEALSHLLRNVMEEMINNPAQYSASRYASSHTGYGHRHGGGLAGAMGGFAAGMLGGMLLSDLLGGAEEEMEGAMGEGESEEDGGFDFFGGDDEF
ncbi:sporulation protein [Ammoniphilus sp. 3BR4]|uniref:sporulation protein n=1 Tax=Ammoniphilus sp. 3BR4 TaxID=3158265 RepID=UPI0034650D8C